AAIAALTTTELHDGWKSLQRTQLYAERIVPAIAATMGLLRIPGEPLRVDHVLSDQSGVPIIFIESENAWDTAHQELQKLCWVAAPLRVVFTVCQWDDTPGIWTSGGRKAACREKWQSILRGQSRVWPNPGLIAVIIAEACQVGQRERVRYYGLCFSGNNGECQEEGVIVERYLDATGGT